MIPITVLYLMYFEILSIFLIETHSFKQPKSICIFTLCWFFGNVGRESIYICPNSKLTLSPYFPPYLELRQYKNDSIWSKDKLGLNLPRFFTRLYGQWKRAAISKIICLWTKWCRSYFVFALAPKNFLLSSDFPLILFL